ncbi:MAG: hypothetical protein H0T46_36770 [Deltaproteobacteria bacterium]|nr:hypothetical protein [Deltaproteobacteria bacterium]
MSGGDDDEATSSRGKPPRAPIVPDRPTIPQLGRVKTRRGVDVAKARAGEDDPLDDGPTTFDPGLPAGMREPAPPSEEQRATEPRSATSPIHDEDEPTGGKAPRTTVIGKRPNQRPGATTAAPAKVVDPREAPTAQLPRPPTGKTPHVKAYDPREAPTAQHQRPATVQPPMRLDDSARTNRWDTPDLQEGPGHRDSGPPTNPLNPQMRAPTNALPPRPTQLPLAPGPRSAPIHAVSMKTAHEVDEDKAARPLPEVRIRAMSELNQTPARGMGYLAPPHDPGEERSRRRRDLIIWGSVAVIVAAVVTLLVWFVAR